jgi:hypothetical protein
MFCINNYSERDHDVSKWSSTQHRAHLLLLAVYGQYLGVAIRVTRVVDAMRLVVLLRQQCDAHETANQRATAARHGGHLGGIHDPKVIHPEKIEAVKPFGLHVILFPNIGQLRPMNTRNELLWQNVLVGRATPDQLPCVLY